jgi:hypothetical protein
MKTDLKYFKSTDFHTALQTFFKDLNIPVNYIAEESARAQDILSSTYKADKETYQLMDDVYFLGMVDDAAFEGGKSLDHRKIESDYDGILIFGVTLRSRPNGLLPTRTQLAEITRSFNREFHYTPVVVVFRYDNAIAFANAERLKYKQEWREGEKAGKVSILRDIDLDTPHSGHLRILSELAIKRSGKKAVNCFADLYSYWQSVFNVSLLNKKFYEELSNWYFWAVKEVTFPGEPTAEDVAKETGKMYDPKRQEELRHEHNAKNVIRLLTRFLFVWFIKEKKLIPEELFDLDYVKNELLKDLSPYHEGALFQSVNIKSHYYKAILQNLFFATLNQEMGKRGFRRDRQHMNVTNLLRYESCFKDPRKFIDLVEAIVPFMNGGLFECLDKPHPTEKGPQGGDVIVYEDGFSDRKDNPLKVPDYLFFGLDEEVDLSSVIGIKNKKTRQAAVKGLINIFNSYKFTIAENTPIEEDIALDPELLGKVFENLLASYNPETKTTARKQTGSFYTPREIVNYMVDESLIAYLKKAVADWGMEDEALDTALHELLSFDPGNPFADNQGLQKEIIKAQDHCTILDPACGSGAFPMGILQKMVHVLQKLDPDNTYWQELQLENAVRESEHAFQNVADKQERQKLLDDINEAFDQQVNDPDYARKLFLIENCIYGVDIQPIAVQISKLRFFISLVVDQKVDKEKENFGIRPLPNLETRFVAANTLIGIVKPDKQGNLFENKGIKKLEEKLKNVRHRIFSAKTPKTKRKLREEDQALREKMGELLIADGWANETARQIAAWDPYDQNMSSPFFDPEWMFGMKDGFDVVIGNPPYITYHGRRRTVLTKSEMKFYRENYKCIADHTLSGKYNSAMFFIEKFLSVAGLQGIITCITDVSFFEHYYSGTKKILLENTKLYNVITNLTSFENVASGQLIIIGRKDKNNNENLIKWHSDGIQSCPQNIEQSLWYNKKTKYQFYQPNTEKTENIIEIIDSKSVTLEKFFPKKLIRTGESVGIKEDGFVVDHFGDTTSDVPVYEYLEGSKSLEKRYSSLIPTRFFRYDVSLLNERNESYRIEAKNHKRNPKVLGIGDKLAFDNNKILIRQSSDNICATYTEKKYIYNRSFYSINNRNSSGESKESLIFILALLNSRLITFYARVKNIIKREKGKQPQIRLGDLKKIPIYNNCKQKIYFEILGRILLFKYNLDIDSVLDGLVFELYFPDHMKEKQIDILQFVEKDLAEVLRGRDFEELPDSEKEEIINKLHARWTHPDSEVRNRIKLFAVRSPDILKPILESR